MLHTEMRPSNRLLLLFARKIRKPNYFSYYFVEKKTLSSCSSKFSQRIFATEVKLPILASDFRINWTMSNQKKISSFFQSPSRPASNTDPAQKENKDDTSKRPLPEEPDTVSGTATKKLKVDVNENCLSSNAVSSENRVIGGLSLSDADRSKIDENRLLAKMKMTATKTRGLVVKIHPSWYNALEPEFNKPYFCELANFIEEERKKCTVYPSADEVFSWTCMTPVKETKVVILGQDPYHGVNQAHGLCFSVKKGITPPPSLENMFKELSTDFEGFVPPKHGCLCGWAEQGVLLLNAVLTVRAHNANSHKDRGWEKFTDAVVSHINKNSHGVVFILWGSYAQKKGSQIDKKKHHVIQGPHPSPLSAHRGFFGSKHFSRCNQLLEQGQKRPIDWSHLP